jgi:hypothetical protein
MGKNDLLIVAAIAAGALYFSSKVGATTEENNGTFGPGVTDGAYVVPLPYASESSTQGKDLSAYNAAVKSFNDAPSIQGGLDVINAGYPSGSLSRTSQTLKVVGYNDTVAKLGDGSIARVTAAPAKTDSQGMTAFDKIIAKNKALKTVTGGLK